MGARGLLRGELTWIERESPMILPFSLLLRGCHVLGKCYVLAGCDVLAGCYVLEVVTYS